MIDYGKKQNIKYRISVVLNIILALMVLFAALYKFTDLRNIIGGGTYNYEQNNWYEPYVYQARNLCITGDADVVMVGDSLTMYGLWDEFFPDVNIANRGIGSDITEGLLNRLDTVVSLSPEKIFIMIGTNDISRGYDAEIIVTNMQEILDELTYELPNAEIYVESVLPRTEKYIDQIEALNSAYENLCLEYDAVTFINLYPLYCDDNGIPTSDLFASDGYHMSGEGYELWISEITEYMEE